MNAHLEAIPGLGALTAGRLSGGDAQRLGGHADGAVHSHLVILGGADQLGADW